MGCSKNSCKITVHGNKHLYPGRSKINYFILQENRKRTTNLSLLAKQGYNKYQIEINEIEARKTIQ